ncbi:sn-glycerol-3-phosphate ABC transporter ATP-binding protein UgpC [Oleiagrimonas citrea]|uniref:sn-glycerol-3-phosphate ABC transporter ATP-binding protein UgpC n=1 Tax=Oleiagrimonas citrea TaxID=1665687 RepID=A0A846ZP03_9GAMM|nr:sn-glycerol-3-phosphate ABC transporter ATP-binding protein UgpC [Oleiagrimonas citrea]NKZ39756.1 sn-glycerol-3-phosphate ABC transporter ATP-binding protein UgpC [Oleiagrimonas citrea]
MAAGRTRRGQAVGSVVLENVTKAYGEGVCAVDDVSFRVDGAQLLVLLGPSGCGKSTTLRMIAGLDSVDSGRILIDGREVHDVEPKDRDIAMVFQNYALYPHMSVAENMAFGLKLRRRPRKEIARRVQEAATMLGLEALLDRRPGALSGGQRQRVALGRALVRQPRVFLLDEPLSNLDAGLRASMRMEIARLHRAVRATMVYVTHDQVEAMTLGQRIVVMDGGRVQQDDTPMRIYERPANLFVAGFLGSPSMNLLRGRLECAAACVHVDGAGRLSLPDVPRVRRALAAHDGREIVVGLRPEALTMAVAGAVVPASLDADLDVIEHVGNEAFLNMRLGAHVLVARVPPQALPEPGRRVRVAYDPAQMHFFEGGSGRRIELDAPV